MGKLIKLQLRNVFHNKLFYVCTGIMILLSPVVTFLFNNSLNINTTLVLPEIITILSVDVVGIVFIALFTCYDYNEGTAKNIIGRGYTRTQFFISKFLVALIGMFAMILIVSLVVFILFINNGLGYSTKVMYSLVNGLFEVIAYTAFFVTISILLEKNGSAIIAGLFIPNIIPLVLSVIDSKLKLNIGNYWLGSQSTIFSMKPTLGNLGWSILNYVIYTFIFLIIGVLLLKKKEIK